MTPRNGVPQVVAEVDCTKESAVCKAEGVTGYPTLKWYEAGSSVGVPTMARTIQGLLKFAQQSIDAGGNETAATVSRSVRPAEAAPSLLSTGAMGRTTAVSKWLEARRKKQEAKDEL